MLSENIFFQNFCPPIFVTQIFAPPIFMTSLRWWVQIRVRGENFSRVLLHLRPSSATMNNEYTDRIAKVQTLGVCAPPLTTPPLTNIWGAERQFPPKEIQQRVSWNIRNFFTELKYYHKFNNKILNYSILQNLRQKFTCKENVPISYTLRYIRSTHNVTSNRSP